VDEVAGPNVVLEPGQLIDAAMGAVPWFWSRFPTFAQSHGPFPVRPIQGWLVGPVPIAISQHRVRPPQDTGASAL
jgi:hypothetical protein